LALAAALGVALATGDATMNETVGGTGGIVAAAAAAAAISIAAATTSKSVGGTGGTAISIAADSIAFFAAAKEGAAAAASVSTTTSSSSTGARSPGVQGGSGAEAHFAMSFARGGASDEDDEDDDDDDRAPKYPSSTSSGDAAPRSTKVGQLAWKLSIALAAAAAWVGGREIERESEGECKGWEMSEGESAWGKGTRGANSRRQYRDLVGAEFTLAKRKRRKKK